MTSGEGGYASSMVNPDRPDIESMSRMIRLGIDQALSLEKSDGEPIL